MEFAVSRNRNPRSIMYDEPVDSPQHGVASVNKDHEIRAWRPSLENIEICSKISLRSSSMN
jgi:hypothetical protein